MTLETQERRPAIEAATYRRLFALRGFPRLAIGTLLGRMAGEMWQIALVLFVLQRFPSPALAGLTAGPALGGFLVGGLGGEGAFLFTAGLFVLSGLVTLGVRDPETRSAATQESLLRSAWQALVYVVRNPTLRGVVVTFWMTNVPSGFLILALPVLALRQFHWGAQGVGVLWSVAGIATVVAGFAFGSIDTRGRERQLIASGMVLAALACLLGLTQTPAGGGGAVGVFRPPVGPIGNWRLSARQQSNRP